MAGLGSPPPGIDLSASQVPRILGVNIATFILAAIAIILRFTARRLARQSYWLDDWLMLPAIVAAAIMMFVSIIYMMDHGLGRHIWIGPQDTSWAVAWAKGLFISEICYTVIICCVKFSLLAFYWPLLKNSDFRVPTYVLTAIVSAWGIAVILITIFQCEPVSAFWTHYMTPAKSFKCGVNVNQFFNGNSIPNIITDAAILILPLPQIWGLSLPKTQKLAVTFIFTLGVFVLCVSITRFTFILKLDITSPDVTWNFVDTQIWTTVESHIGIACACLPTLLPFLNLILFGSVHRDSRPGVNASSYSRFGKPHDWEGPPQTPNHGDELDSIDMMGRAGLDDVELANRPVKRTSDPPRIQAGSKRHLLPNGGGEISVSTEISVEGGNKAGKKDYQSVSEIETYVTPFPHPVMRPSGGLRAETDDYHQVIQGLNSRR